MEVEADRFYGVLTGDLVNSTRYPARVRTRVPGWLRGAARELRRAIPGAVYGRLHLYRGDGWQLFVPDASRCFASALYMRAYLLARTEEVKVITRCSIGIGPVTSSPGSAIHLWQGPAFTLSGRGLDEMNDPLRMRVRCEAEGLQPALDVVAVLLELAASRWTARQAQSLCGALTGWTQQEIADRLWDGEVSQQAVAQHLSGAGWQSIRVALRYTEEAILQTSDVVNTNNKL